MIKTRPAPDLRFSPRRPMARGALVRLQARDGSRTSDKLPSLACRASASITGWLRKRLLRLRDKTAPLMRPSPPPAYAMVSSLHSGISIAPPARCIHSPQRDTSSAEYRLLVSLASCGASRELSSRRSPALAPHTCAVSPTFRYGAFVFVASALAAVPPARLTTYGYRATNPLRTPSPTRKQEFYKGGAVHDCSHLTAKRAR